MGTGGGGILLRSRSAWVFAGVRSRSFAFDGVTDVSLSDPFSEASSLLS